MHLSVSLILAIIGLIATFYFSGTEAAYTVFNKIRLDIWQKQERRFLWAARKFVERPDDFFTTVLIGTNLANILYTTFATVYLIEYMDETLAWLLITFIVLFVGEIFPKTLFRSLADYVILPLLLFLYGVFLILKIFIIIINAFVNLLLRFLHIRHETVGDYFSREELELLLRSGLGRSAVNRDQKKYITRVLEFSESRVREAMIPRTEIVAAETDVSVDELIRLMEENNVLKVLIYKENLDEVLGVLFAYDLLDVPLDLSKKIHPLPLVPETKRCAQLLQEFQEQNISIALVVDEYGGTAGLITMDDLIEEVFGSFTSAEEEESAIKALNDHTWIIDARADLEEIAERLNLHFEEGEYETLAGWIIARKGYIPKTGEIIVRDEFRVEILKRTPKKIEQVKLIRNVSR